MPSNNTSSNTIGGTVVTIIIFIVIVCISSIAWVNSGANSDTFFGQAFQLPLETKEHYCWRKSDRVITIDMDAYNKCMSE